MPAHGREAQHYATLDILRGVAALTVLAYHLPLAGISPRIIGHGYLAVDFFFELSGFVLAFTYRGRLMRGITFRRFVIDRLIRLYPLAVVGILAGSLAIAPQGTEALGAGEGDPSELALVTAFNTLLIPDPFAFRWTQGLLFPGNGAVWSLFFEILVNLVWAAAAYRLAPRRLAALCAVSLAGLIVLTASHGSADIGYTWATVPGGAARALFGFMVGTLIQAGGWAPRFSSRSAVLPVACLLAVFVAPKFGLPNWFHDIACIALAFPLSIAMSIARARESPVSRFMGRMSYPLYVVQLPLLVAVRRAFPDGSGGVSKLLLGVATVAACLSASFLLYRFYDEPVREVLRSRIHRNRGGRIGRARETP